MWVPENFTTVFGGEQLHILVMFTLESETKYLDNIAISDISKKFNIGLKTKPSIRTKSTSSLQLLWRDVNVLLQRRN